MILTLAVAAPAGIPMEPKTKAANPIATRIKPHENFTGPPGLSLVPESLTHKAENKGASKTINSEFNVWNQDAGISSASAEYCLFNIHKARPQMVTTLAPIAATVKGYSFLIFLNIFTHNHVKTAKGINVMIVLITLKEFAGRPGAKARSV